MQTQFIGTGDVARRLGVRPREVSDALYQRKVNMERCPLISGRRMIPVDLLDEIAAAVGVRVESVTA